MSSLNDYEYNFNAIDIVSERPTIFQSYLRVIVVGQVNYHQPQFQMLDSY
jgi:hypothetical protein